MFFENALTGLSRRSKGCGDVEQGVGSVCFTFPIAFDGVLPNNYLSRLDGVRLQAHERKTTQQP